MAGTMKIFCIWKNFFSRGKRNLLFLPCNMAAVQNLYSLLPTFNVTVRSLNSPKTQYSFSEFKFSLNGGDLVIWFAFNRAVHFRLKMEVTFEIPSSKATNLLSTSTFNRLDTRMLPRNSASHTLFHFVNFSLIPYSAICFRKQHARSELTNR